MTLLVHHRAARASVLVLYALIAGVGQGLHMFADPDACHGVHQAAHECSCGEDHGESAFARRAADQVAAAPGGAVVHRGAAVHEGGGGHRRHDCVVCESLAQLVASAPADAPAPGTLPVPALDRPLSQRVASVQVEGLHTPRGPPSDVANA